MPLSKEDRRFYEGKLGYRAFSILLLATAGVGMVAVPVVLYLQDSSLGQTQKWTGNLVFNLVVMGFLLGSVVSVVMYLGFKFLLSMGWLPSRSP
jgi:hypothetical protein